MNRHRMSTVLAVSGLLGGLLLPGAPPGSADPAGPAPSSPLLPSTPLSAVALLQSQAGADVGTVSFQDIGGGRTKVHASVTGLTPMSEFHGFHVHTNGACAGDFVASAGGHWNPGGGGHGDHAGDMPVLYADAGGAATTSFVTDAFTTEQLLADPGGVAVIVHAGRDNYANIPNRYGTGGAEGPDAVTLATGDAGGRYACGVVARGPLSVPGGHWTAAADGGVFSHGTAAFHGSQGGTALRQPVVALAPTPGGAGYYLAASDGGVFTHGDASFEGSAGGIRLRSPVVDIALPPVQARAVMRNQAGAEVGQVGFTQEGGRVRVSAYVTGLAPLSEFHGFHVHANGACAGDFTGAGGHWNPAGSNHGDHTGDMPVLYADATGVARASYTLDTFSAAGLLADPGGLALIVHGGRDNYGNIPARYTNLPTQQAGPDPTTNATGDAGARIACGVIGAPGGSDRAGYWLAASDGGVFAYGDAPFLGSLGATPLHQPIVGMTPTPSGDGYWLAAADGGVFAYGDAPFLGSLGSTRLHRPIVAMAATPTGRGYILIANDGGVFSFGDAPFLGSLAGRCECLRIEGGDLSESGQGYALFTDDGSTYGFGDAASLGGPPLLFLKDPVVDGAVKR